MKIAFFKGFKSQNPIDWLICIVTMSKYSHCEIVYGYESFSSSLFDGGVRRKVIDFEKHPNRWDMYDIKLNALKSDKFLKFYEHTKNKKYNLLGIIFVYLFGLITYIRNDKYYCSDWCYIQIKYLLGYVNPRQINISPKGLFKYLKNKNII